MPYRLRSLQSVDARPGARWVYPVLAIAIVAGWIAACWICFEVFV